MGESRFADYLFSKVMVANAGMCRIKPMLDMTAEEFEQELSVNLAGRESQLLRLEPPSDKS
jgi:NAD(P)-dependent dehydrogenase (short-subunit alcohol dehydrogenase family)